MSVKTTQEPIEDPVQKMNRMYRWTRHVYDGSRRYYLLGRDRLLDAIAERPGEHVLEIGCGTARNLRILGRRAPQHTLYGIDASLSMLATARAKLGQRAASDKITLGHGLAQDFKPTAHLGVDRDFDVIFFSYVLSMIPCWPEALEAALAHLAPDGQLYIVDFWDQAGLPSWIAVALQRWLALFDVYPRPALVDTLQRFDEIDGLSAALMPIAHRYAYLATIQASGSVPAEAFEGLKGEERRIKTV